MWSMPHNVLRVVASGVACCAALGFVLGLNSAGHRPRLPGEAVGSGSGAPMQAADAQAISSEEIAPPASTDVDPDEKKDGDKPPPPKLALGPSEPVALNPVEPTASPPDKVGDLLDAVQASQDEPPH